VEKQLGIVDSKPRDNPLLGQADVANRQRVDLEEDNVGFSFVVAIGQLLLEEEAHGQSNTSYLDWSSDEKFARKCEPINFAVVTT